MFITEEMLKNDKLRLLFRVGYVCHFNDGRITMKSVRKRVLSIILCISMVLPMLSDVTVNAEESESYPYMVYAASADNGAINVNADYSYGLYNAGMDSITIKWFTDCPNDYAEPIS